MTEISSTSKKKATVIKCAECEGDTTQPWALTLSKIEGGTITQSAISKKVCETCAESLDKKIAQITQDISRPLSEQRYVADVYVAAEPEIAPAPAPAPAPEIIDFNAIEVNNLDDWLITIKDAGAVVLISSKLYEDLTGKIIAIDQKGLIIKTANRQVFISSDEIQGISADL